MYHKVNFSIECTYDQGFIGNHANSSEEFWQEFNMRDGEYNEIVEHVEYIERLNQLLNS